jgi:serine/threonine-protein kinase
VDDRLNRRFAGAALSYGHPARMGRYTIKSRLESGGMADVYAGELESADGTRRRVAIKRMRPSLLDDPSFVRMFVEEARIGVELAHPRICKVYELFRIANEYCMAMEYLHGVTLSRLLAACRRSGRPIPSSIALGIIAQACEGLHYAHEGRDASGRPMGVIHRDVSPQNLMVCSDGAVKVLDFGIAKLEDSSHVTSSGGVKGKGSYMSPEQLHGGRLDRRTDVWSLGVVALEALSGKNPFRQTSLMDTAHAITCRPLPSLRRLRPDAPEALCRVIERALCRQRDLRVRSADELRRALLEAVGVEHVATEAMIGAFVRDVCARALSESVLHFEPSRLPSCDAIELEDESSGSADHAWIAALTKVRQHAAKGPGPSAPPPFEGLGPALDSAQSPAGPLVVASRSDSSLGPKTRSRVAARRRSQGGALIALAFVVTAAWWNAAQRTTASHAGISLLTPEVHLSPALRTTNLPPAALHGPAVVLPETSASAAAPRTPRSVSTEGSAALAEPSSPEPDVASPAPGHDQEPAGRSVRRKPGLLYLDAQPYATIFLDGRELGVTPILGASVPSGRHALRAVTADGRVAQLAIDVSPEEPLRKRFTW